YWYIITDNNDNILAYLNSANGNTLDLSAAPAGECHVWGWNYKGEPNPVMGEHISTLGDGDCEDISDNWITVYRETPDGGMVSLTDGSTSYANCAGDITFDVMHSTTAPNLSYWYIITDNNDNILAYLNSANGNTLDWSAAPAGECHVWGWNYKGEPNPVMGEHISTLGDGECEDISDNWITVYRETPDGGMVSLTDGSTAYSNCAGNIVFDVTHTTDAPNLSYWYIITDNNDNILGYLNSANGNTLDLSAAPAGECHVWGWNYKGEPNPVMGEHISTLGDGDCEDISSNWITVTRLEGNLTLSEGNSSSTASGLNIYTVEACDGQAPYDVSLDIANGFASVQEFPSSNPDCIQLQITYANGADWTLMVSDAACGDQAFTSDNIAATPLLVIDDFDTSNETCPGVKDGSTQVNVSGGDTSCGTYTYSWTGPNGFVSAENPIYDIASGLYEVTVTDCAGTMVTSEIYVSRTNSGGRGRGRGRGACKTVLEEMVSDFNFKPNPATDFVQISFDIQEDLQMFDIHLMDLTGRSLQQISVDGNGSVSMDLSNVPNGMYLINLQADGQVIRQEKLVLVK
ncbi:MAG: T9SS type A sorting domain-containing protein, partial [Chitinophagales bacterium]